MNHKYQVMPALTQREYKDLETDILKRGVQVPIELDEDGNVLDGFHRLMICQKHKLDYPSIIRKGMTEDEKIEHAWALNLARRHLTPEKRRELVLRFRQEGQSTRQIAEKLKVSARTVRRDLATGANAPVDLPSRIIGKDGKSRPARKPEPIHRLIHQSNNNEWYTPMKYLEAARQVMGGIDIDPASSTLANETVKATRYFTAEDDGLLQDWHGRVWLNPPYGGIAASFVASLLGQYQKGIVTEAILLVNSNSTETKWFAPLWDFLLCFTDHRINFTSPSKTKPVGSTHGSVFVYLGDNEVKFIDAFEQFGYVVRRVENDHQKLGGLR